MHTSSSIDLDALHDFVVPSAEDIEELLDLTATYFVELEPHNKSLGLTASEARPILLWLISKSLHYPFSVKVVEKATGDIVAASFMSVGHRNPSLDYVPFELQEEDIKGAMIPIGTVLDEAKNLFWATINENVNQAVANLCVKHYRPRTRRSRCSSPKAPSSADDIGLLHTVSNPACAGLPTADLSGEGGGNGEATAQHTGTIEK